MRGRLTGLAATILLVGIVVGLPAALIAVAGNPLPDSMPTWDQVSAALTRPDNGTLALGVIVWVGWIAWAVLTVCVLVELVALARGLRAPQVPTLGGPQLAARALVSTAALLFATAPLLTQATGATPAPAATITSAAPAAQAPQTPAAPAPEPVGVDEATTGAPGPDNRFQTHLTRPGDTLWALAQQYLGDGHRYPEIAAANSDLIKDPDFLRPGWQLAIPLPANGPRAQEPYVVQPGDTLSQIAQDHLGDASRHPEIAEASRYTVQPGGQHLEDPDLILPGWTLTLPGQDAATDPTAAGAQNDVAPPALRPAVPDLDQVGFHAATGSSKPVADSIATLRRDLAQATPATPVETEQPAEPAVLAPPAVTVTDGSGDGQSAATDEQGPPAWLLTGLIGAGVVLAGGAATQLRRNRRAQFRSRRPGTTITPVDPVLVAVEKTLHIQHADVQIEAMDTALRALARDCTAQNVGMPHVAAAELSGDQVTLHLAEPNQLPHPWRVLDQPTRWARVLDTAETVTNQPAPYPLLLTIGHSDQGSVWLLNVETFGTITLDGDPTFAADFARYLAAEVACNEWAADVTLHCIGAGAEAARMNPARVVIHDQGDQGAGEVLAASIAQADRATNASTTAPEGRATQAGDDLWPARLVLCDLNASGPNLAHLIGLIDANPDQSGTAVVVQVGPDPTPAPWQDDVALLIQLTSDGRVQLPAIGLDLVAAGLTEDEAQGIAALLEQSQATSHEPVPVDVDAPAGTWRAFADEAGALRDEYTQPRHHNEQDAEPNEEPAAGLASTGQRTSLLPGPDSEYLQAAATTVEDLAELAPAVPQAVQQEVHEADPSLDQDVASWFDPKCPLPRVSLLGPVKVRTRGRATAVAKSKDYYAELLSYLATRRAGATLAEIAAAFNIAESTARKHLHLLRAWLGTNPHTREPHLPDARKSPPARDRGVGIYQVQDLLVDADLFRRLRVRGQARGPEGLDDLCTALRLVTGTPLDPDSLRPGGWSWMLEGDRIDQHLLVAIVDTAHVVTTGCLREGDIDRARTAAEVAALAGPDEEIPQLDLAAVAAAAGEADQAGAILAQRVHRRSVDDSGAPGDTPARTRKVLTHKGWPARTAS